jgi:hypothetical protein
MSKDNLKQTCRNCQKKSMQWSDYCGTYVCNDCDHHQSSQATSLARCYCGWAIDGGNGYNQLIEMGENI